MLPRAKRRRRRLELLNGDLVFADQKNECSAVFLRRIGGPRNIAAVRKQQGVDVVSLESIDRSRLGLLERLVNELGFGTGKNDIVFADYRLL